MTYITSQISMVRPFGPERSDYLLRTANTHSQPPIKNPMQEKESIPSFSLTSGKSLAKNTVWNLVGQGVPIIAAVFAIPLLIKGLGVDRFGVLTLAWMVIGYFSLFDFGIGRALTKVVAEKLGNGQTEDIPAIAWTALFLMLLLGVAGAFVIASLSSWLVTSVLKIPAVLQHETLNTFYLLALSIPIVISTAALRGLLEAYQRFDLANIIRVPMGLFMFLGPLMVLPFSKSLFSVVAVLVAGRLIAWFAHLAFCLGVVPGLKGRMLVRAELLGPLFRFGGWMSVSNLIGPLMVYLDRFLIGAFVSMAAVAYYTTPYEIVTKLWILPTALVGALFPAFASILAHDRIKAVQLFQRGTNYVFLLIFPLTLIIVIFAPEGLQLWLGTVFSQESSTVFRWLAVGVLLNSLAHVPFSLIQGAGRPDMTAKLHAAELPFYLVVLWWLLSRYGIEGAAIAWLLRVLVDTVMLFHMAHRVIPCKGFLLRLSAYLCAGLLALLLGVLLHGGIMKVAYLIIVLGIFSVFAWTIMLSTAERAFFSRRLNLQPK